MAAIQRAALRIPAARGRFGSGRLIGVVAGALVIFGALLQVNQFSAVTGTGYEIEQLNRERAAKQAENHELEAEVARLSSLARVDIEARVRLGMEPAKRRIHMEVIGTVPDHQTLPTRFLPSEPAAVESGEPPLWKRLADLLPF
jgi:cell division protein FtsL